MNIELLIAGSFILIVIVEAITLLKKLNSKSKEEFFSLLFRFMANSFVYVAALLIFISTTHQQSGTGFLQFNNLKELTLGQAAIWIIIITDIITLLSIVTSSISKVVAKQEETVSKNIIDQTKAKNVQ